MATPSWRAPRAGEGLGRQRAAHLAIADRAEHRRADACRGGARRARSPGAPRSRQAPASSGKQLPSRAAAAHERFPRRPRPRAELPTPRAVGPRSSTPTESPAMSHAERDPNLRVTPAHRSGRGRSRGRRRGCERCSTSPRSRPSGTPSCSATSRSARSRRRRTTYCSASRS